MVSLAMSLWSLLICYFTLHLPEEDVGAKHAHSLPSCGTRFVHSSVSRTAPRPAGQGPGIYSGGWDWRGTSFVPPSLLPCSHVAPGIPSGLWGCQDQVVFPVAPKARWGLQTRLLPRGQESLSSSMGAPVLGWHWGPHKGAWESRDPVGVIRWIERECVVACLQQTPDISVPPQGQALARHTRSLLVNCGLPSFSSNC